MNTPQLPSVELIQGPPPAGPADAHRGRRWKVFFVTLLATAAIGLAIVYGRQPVYRASASVLTVQPKAIDRRSAEADTEHVAIQRRLLLGEDLLGRLADRLTDDGEGGLHGPEALRTMLSAVAVPDTNLLELRAEGPEPLLLQQIVNRWAESYEAFRAQEIEAATGRTTAELRDQQVQLQIRIEVARGELQRFRAANDIISLERGENRSLAELKGLNNSLNKARDRLIEARARKVAVDEAIARGETVIPSEQKADIAKLQRNLQRLRSRIAGLQQRYTQHYIDRDPALKALPEELRALESELAHALQLAKVTVSDEAQQAIEAARVSVTTLERRLAEHQREVQQFTDRFKEFKTLEDGLARLDRLYAENEERLAQIQVRNLKKYPPIQVVEWARVPGRPIYPDYRRDLLIALAAAFATALLVTWLVEYLSERSRPAHTAPYLGVRVYPGETAPGLTASPIDNRLGHTSGTVTPANLPVLPRELASAEIASLLALTDPVAGGYATLLLSGVSPYELPLLHSSCFDQAADLVSVPGANRRDLSLGAVAWRHLGPVLRSMDDARMALPVAEIDVRLLKAAQDAQLADPGSINALALWHSYVIYLMRQGLDSSNLTRRVGAIPPDVHAVLMHYAPPGGSRPLDGIEFVHPALAT